MSALRKKAVNVAITSDLMCPWCWVGLRKLQAASKRTDIDVIITWKAFLLRTGIPEEGILKADPTPEGRVGKRLKLAGQEVGIDFTGLTDRTPNTLIFHAVMKLLQDEQLKMNHQQVTKFQEAVFEGYFTLGIFPDRHGLLKIARTVDIPGLVTQIEALFQDEKTWEELQGVVLQEARQASRNGVSGVPFFEFNGVPTFSGAQPVEKFMVVLEEHAK